MKFFLGTFFLLFCVVACKPVREPKRTPKIEQGFWLQIYPNQPHIATELFMVDGSGTFWQASPDIRHQGKLSDTLDLEGFAEFEYHGKIKIIDSTLFWKREDGEFIYRLLSTDIVCNRTLNPKESFEDTARMLLQRKDWEMLLDGDEHEKYYWSFYPFDSDAMDEDRYQLYRTKKRNSDDKELHPISFRPLITTAEAVLLSNSWYLLITGGGTRTSESKMILVKQVTQDSFQGIVLNNEYPHWQACVIRSHRDTLCKNMNKLDSLFKVDSLLETPANKNNNEINQKVWKILQEKEKIMLSSGLNYYGQMNWDDE